MSKAYLAPDVEDADHCKAGRKTLYHLISEQVWQNLLPLLAIKPKRVVQVHSAGSDWESRARNLERFCRLHQADLLIGLALEPAEIQSR